MILPNGNSIVIENLPATDVARLCRARG
ncbi:hypothetical protein [Bradyrhizobium pachyrhizi]